MSLEEERFAAMVTFLNQVRECIDELIDEHRSDFIKLGISGNLDSFQADIFPHLDEVWYPIAQRYRRGEGPNPPEELIRRVRLTLEVDLQVAYDEKWDDWCPAMRATGAKAYAALQSYGGKNIIVTAARPLGRSRDDEATAHEELKPCPFCRSVLWTDSCCPAAIRERQRLESGSDKE